ncbi:MAG: hypothetical protein WC724_01305 [Candidatus Paceibacterota bacterium]|jgi:hypothetical protein
MDKIYKIEYVDASYTYEKKIAQTKLDSCEAYGYVEKNGSNIIISFIKKMGVVGSLVANKEKIIEGLVIPDTALISRVKSYKTDILNDMKVGLSISVTWRDVIHVANLPIYECPTMYTEGILFEIKKDYVILKDPKTMRIQPKPLKNHPSSGLPTYLVIPISFISSIEVFK